MTVLVGVKCTDGVVIGADSMATFAMGRQPLVQIEIKDKIRVFDNQIIVAATGAVGYTQRLHLHIEAAVSGGVFKNLTRPEMAGNVAKRLLTDFQNTMVPTHSHSGLGFGALLAAAPKNEACLIEYGTTDFQPEVKEKNLFFVSMGSGQQLADPFLAFVARVLWKDTMPTVKEGKFGVYWVLDHTIRLAPGGVGRPIRIATLQQVDGKWKAEETTDPQEASQYIKELEEWICEQARTGGKPAEKAEPIPQPPAENK